MASDLAAVIEAGLALDLDERAVVAHRLPASLHTTDEADQAEVDAAWRDEIGRRVDDFLSGNAKLISVEESHAQLRAELAARRK